MNKDRRRAHQLAWRRRPRNAYTGVACGAYCILDSTFLSALIEASGGPSHTQSSRSI